MKTICIMAVLFLAGCATQNQLVKDSVVDNPFLNQRWAQASTPQARRMLLFTDESAKPTIYIDLTGRGFTFTPDATNFSYYFQKYLRGLSPKEIEGLLGSPHSAEEHKGELVMVYRDSVNMKDPAILGIPIFAYAKEKMDGLSLKNCISTLKITVINGQAKYPGGQDVVIN